MFSNEEKKEREIKSKNILGKIRSRYILKQIFDSLHKKSFLKFSQYNKQMQKILKISIKDFQKYSEIEIEITLKGYGKFINIPDNEEDREHFHIYFKKNKQEEKIKRDYIKKEEKFRKIRVVIDYGFKSFNKLFSYCKYIKSINFKHFERNNIENMSYMFNECSSLEKINFSHFNTENVTNISYMF